MQRIRLGLIECGQPENGVIALRYSTVAEDYNFNKLPKQRVLIILIAGKHMGVCSSLWQSNMNALYQWDISEIMAQPYTIYAERVLMANNMCDRCLVQNHMKKIKSQSIQLATTCSLAYTQETVYMEVYRMHTKKKYCW